MKKTAASIIGIAWLLGAMGPIPGAPAVSCADIYRWQDDSGVIHFTDTPSNVPEKYRSREKMILKGPVGAGRPTLSTVGPPPPGPPLPASSGPPSEIPPPLGEGGRPDREGPSENPEQLRARIAAKERFVEGIDRKRSHTLNPMGNRFVSPEDLELYKKYSEELPQDRQRLKELQSGKP